MQAILDRIARMPQGGKTVKDTEMDSLRRMAETINRELLDEALIRSVGEAMDESGSDVSLAPATSSDGTSAGGSATVRSNSPAHASQMQAYRENA